MNGVRGRLEQQSLPIKTSNAEPVNGLGESQSLNRIRIVIWIIINQQTHTFLLQRRHTLRSLTR